MKKPSFKKRYVLGEGYPERGVFGGGYLTTYPEGKGNYAKEKWPNITHPDCPKYRLVLERVK